MVTLRRAADLLVLGMMPSVEPCEDAAHGLVGAVQQAHVTGMNIRRSASPAERLPVRVRIHPEGK